LSELVLHDTPQEWWSSCTWCWCIWFD
jgi:hypothetical protein